MKNNEMNKFIKHIDYYFQQSDCTILHPIVANPHIDVLFYKPNNAYPYWKLVTMGASDYKMPPLNPSLGDRNEYIMFIDSNENLEDEKIRFKYYNYLMEVALFPIHHNCHITYGHSLEWPVEQNEEMEGAFIELPQIITNPNVLHCKLGLLKTITCLQVILLTRKDINKLQEIGPEQFSNFLYPEDNSPRHFLCELHRTEKF